MWASSIFTIKTIWEILSTKNNLGHWVSAIDFKCIWIVLKQMSKKICFSDWLDKLDLGTPNISITESISNSIIGIPFFSPDSTFLISLPIWKHWLFTELIFCFVFKWDLTDSINFMFSCMQGLWKIPCSTVCFLRLPRWKTPTRGLVCLKLSKGDLQVHDLCSTPPNSSQNHLTRHVENDSSKGSSLIGTHLAMYGFILLSEEFELVITGPMSCVSCPTHISAIKNMPCPQEGKAKHPFLYPSV